MAALSERLIKLRNERNILQKDVAISIDIGLRSYQRYESGEREPTASVLIALADYYDVTLDYLVGRPD